MTTINFNYTGSGQSFTVPTGITSIVIEAWGGGSPAGAGATGGGYVKGTLAVTPGEVLSIYVGQKSISGTAPATNGGAEGGAGGYGYSGAGSSDVRQGGTALANRKIVAGGAGGIGNTGGGGAGGGLTGANGSYFGSGIAFGTGGTQSAGGTGFANGVLGKGGSGGAGGGGGGGGGYYGGGAGGGNSTNGNGGGGGGGSSYVGGVTNSTNTQGVATSDGNGLVTITYNSNPSASTLTSPASSAVIDRAATNRFTWTFTDADSGDTQTKFDLQYRLVGAGTWTTITQTTPNTFYDFGPGSIAAGNYEWQIRTYDTLGFAGPFSPSSFFTAADAPTGPTITAPVNGGTISDASGTIVWSTPAQDAYEVRRVADNAGSPDANNIYSDTGVVTSTTTRNQSLSFPTNLRYEHLQVRVRSNTLWSTWSSVRVLISYTPPATPTLVATPISTAGLATADSIAVAVTNPVPNLLTLNQSNIETDTTGLVAYNNSTIARSTAQFLSGSASLAVTATSATNPVRAATSSFPSVVPGQVYTAVASIRAATTSRPIRVDIDWQDGSNGYLSTSVGGFSADNASGWTQVSVTGQAPTGAANARLVFLFNDGTSIPAANETHYVDAIGLYADPTGNLIANPDFENGVPGGVFSTTRALTGRGSCLITPGTSSYSGIAVYTGPLIVGQTYTLSYSIWADSTPNLNLAPDGMTPTAFSYDGVPKTFGDPAPTFPTGKWVRVVITGVATSATSAFWIRSSNGGSAPFYVDGVQLVTGPTALPYVPPVTYNLFPGGDGNDYAGFFGYAEGGATQTDTVTTVSDALFGTRVWRVIPGGTSGVAQIIGSTEYDGVQTVSAYVRGPVGETASIILYGIGYSTSNSATVTLTGAWQRISVTMLSPRQVRLVVNATATAAGRAFDWDGLQIELGSVATPYFNGSTGTDTKWEASDNLLVANDASFEVGSVGSWSANTGFTGAASTAQVYSGSYSYAATRTGAAISVATDGPYLPGYTWAAGLVYTISAYVRSASAMTVGLGFAHNSGRTTGPGVAIPANTWTRVLWTDLLPSGVTGIVPFFSISSMASGQVLYFDAVQVEQRPIATPYGSTGAANASVSKRQKPWTATPPAVVTNDIYVRPKLDPSKAIRLKALLGPNGTWTWPTPASGVEYEFQVRATSANNVTATSLWTA